MLALDACEDRVVPAGLLTRPHFVDVPALLRVEATPPRHERPEFGRGMGHRSRFEPINARPDRVIAVVSTLPVVRYVDVTLRLEPAVPSERSGPNTGEVASERIVSDPVVRVAAVRRASGASPSMATDLETRNVTLAISTEARSPTVDYRDGAAVPTSEQRAPTAAPISAVGMASGAGDLIPAEPTKVVAPPADLPAVEIPIAPPMSLPTVEDLATFGVFLGVPLAGAVGVDLAAAQAGAEELLAQLATLADELPAADVDDPSLWLIGAAVLAGAAGYAVANAPRRRVVRPGPLPDSVLARWEETHAG